MDSTPDGRFYSRSASTSVTTWAMGSVISPRPQWILPCFSVTLSNIIVVLIYPAVSVSSMLYHVLIYDFLLMINCHLSSISHRFRDIASLNRKPPHPTLSPGSKELPSNFAVKLTKLKVRTFMWKPRDPIFSRLVTIHSRCRRTTDRQHIMTIAGHCNEIATFG